MKYLSAAENRPAWICVQVILNEDSIKPEDFDKIKNRVIKVITNEYLYVNREPKALWKRVENRCNKIDNVNNFSTYFQQAIVCANHATGITIMRYSNDRELARKDMLHIKVNNEEITVETDTLGEGVPVEAEMKSYVLLLVEDNETMLEFMSERLLEVFTVETAKNGQEALEVLRSRRIDLVISDIMMPVMNGWELCKEIKSDMDLSHIPVIFLTAKNDIDSKINGLKIGAEAYVEKPFSFNYLKTQIVSLLYNRQKEREAFSKRPFFPTNKMQMNKVDEEFMNKVIRTIEENIIDTNLNVEHLAEILGMSRSSLLRKIKMLSNLSPVDFIRLIRLRKAAELIHEGKYLIGDICFMVGINSPSYFSKLFLKQFGMTPKDFEKQSQADKEKIDMPS